MPTESFLRVADLLPEAVLLVAADGTVLAANRAVEGRLGHAPWELAGRPLAGIVADPPGAVADYLRACSRTRAMVPGSLRVRGPGGAEVACRAEGAVYRPAADGSPALVLVRLSPRHAAANQFAALNLRIEELTTEVRRRKQAEDATREQREWLRVTLSSIGDAVIATDTAGRVTFINPVAEALTGWPQAEATGRPLDDVFHIVNEDTRRPVENPVTKVLREGVVVGLANHTVLIAQGGSETPIDDCAAPIRREGNAVVGAVLVFHAIAERRKLERELSRQNARLVEADRRKDEFLAMLGHELRNPLAPLTTSLALLRHARTGDTLVEQARTVMERQVRHLTRLVDDLLDVGRITRGRIELRKERVDLNDLVDRAVEAVEPLVAAQRHDLAVSSPRGKVWLEADPARVQQVLVNLLNNACKYTPAGGRVSLTVQREGAEVAVAVRDNGVGLAPEVLPTVFDLFTQAERSLARSEGGLGVGLTMVKKLVEMHGGRVEARSEGIGRGSEFVVHLPGATAEPPALPPPAAFAGGFPAPTGRGLRVLIVDDNVDAADSLAVVLRAFGHEVVGVAHDGLAAVAAVTSARPAVVVLDIGLPGLSGYDVARRVRADGVAPRPYLIAVTGYGLEADKLKAREAGIDAHVVKPIDPERLRELLTTIGAGPA